MTQATYQIKPNLNKNSFEIFSNKESHNKIIKFLLERGLFVKDHRSYRSHFLEIDHRSLKALLEGGNQIEVAPKNKPTINQSEIISENELSEKIKDHNLDLRIWCKKDGSKKIYCSEIEGDIYSCEDLEKLISFIKGDYLVESNKPITSFSLNPLTAFGFTDVAQDVFSANKSILSYNFKTLSHKKQFHPVIEHIEHFKILIDGADDTANAMNNTGLPQQTIALVQGLTIFPLFLKGVHLGYDGLGEEAKETFEAFQAADLKRAEIAIKLDQFKEELCAICKIHNNKNQTPQKFLKEVAKSLAITSDITTKNKIIELAAKFQKEIESDITAPEIKDVLAAHAGWMAMTSMMTSVGVYEAQALVNIFGGVKNITSSSNAKLPLFSQIGNIFGFAGQSLMTIYAFHKMIDERKSWLETEAELEQFKNAKDISDLGRKISEKILDAKRLNHKVQTYGNAALSAGQAMMAIGGPIGLGLNPLLYSGLAATLSGVATNSISELRYQTSYKIDENLDEIEIKILTAAPQFNVSDFPNLGAALARNAKERIFALEILGHLRAPQLVLYRKFIEENKNDSGILNQTARYFGGEKFSKWLNNPPQESTDLVKDNPQIRPHPKNKNDLDIFNVEESDLEFALKTAQDLQARNKSHLEIVKTIQREFIDKKRKEADSKEADSVKTLCNKIINQNDASGLYLRKKLLRAVANGDLKYDGKLEDGSKEIRKNGKKIIAAKLDLNKFDESELEEFLTRKRPQKNSFSREKKSVLEKSHKKNLYDVKSKHLRPIAEIANVSNLSEDFLENYNANNLPKIQPPIILEEEEKLSETTDSDKEAENSTIDEDGPKDESIPLLRRVNNRRASFKKSEPLQNILQNFNSLANEPIATSKTIRRQQIKEQNDTIDKIKGREFKLASSTKDSAKNQTTFVYLDPFHTDPKDPDYEAKQIIYIRDDKSGKIDVIYGKKARALIIERPDERKNGVINKLEDEKNECFGAKQHSIFKSFSVRNEKIPSNSPFKMTALNFSPSKPKTNIR